MSIKLTFISKMTPYFKPFYHNFSIVFIIKWTNHKIKIQFVNYS